MKDLTVIFDLDGTMVDTAPDLIAATNYTLRLIGLGPVAEAVIEPGVAHGSRAMISAAMGSLGLEPPAEELSRLVDEFIDYYRDNIAVHSRPFPGFTRSAETLVAGGARLGICTNKREDLARKLIGELALDHLFAAIIGADTLPVRKPHGDHLLGAISAAGGDASRAVMVGDASADAGAARNANVPFVAVSFGYGEKPVEVLKPDAIIDSFDALIPAIRKVLR
jgi:phosphoglycolate phosphatase